MLRSFQKFVETVEGLTAKERAEFYTYGVIAFATGIAFGVELGYNDAPDCTSKAFSENLLQKDFWEAVSGYYIENHSVFFVYDDKGFPRIDKSRGTAAILASKKRADIIRSLEAKPQFEDVGAEADLSHLWLSYALNDVSKSYVPRFWILENQFIKVNEQREWSWEAALENWGIGRAPVAARIFFNRRFPGDIMVVLRRWTIDEHDHVTSFDFTSPPSTQNPLQLEKDLKSLNWEKSKSYMPIEEGKLLDINF